MSTDAAQPIHPRQKLAPGWYWAFVDNNADGAKTLRAFIAANQPNVFVTQTTVGESTGLIFKTEAPYVWILFQVKNTVVVWTLPGFPTTAPKGEATRIKDIVPDDHRVPAVTSPEHPFNKFFGWGWLTGEGDLDGSNANNPLARAGESVRTALKVLMYGGITVILLQLFLATGGLGNIRAAFKKDDAPAPRRLPQSRNLLPAGR